MKDKDRNSKFVCLCSICKRIAKEPYGYLARALVLNSNNKEKVDEYKDRNSSRAR